MSLLLRGSVLAVVLFAGGCVTSSGGDSAAAKQPSETATTAAAAPAQTVSADQAWAGRDLPDYNTATSRTAAASLDNLSSGPSGVMPMTAAPAPANAGIGAASVSPPAPRQEMAAAAPAPRVAPPPVAPARSASPEASAPAARQVADATPAQQRPSTASGGQNQTRNQAQAPAQGQANGGDDKKEEQLQRLVQAYAGVSGGYFLNEQCNVLTEAQDREYEWHMTLITAALSREVRPDVLDRARGVTRKNVSEQFKDCGDQAKPLVAEAFEAAQRMNKSITGQTYKGKESDTELVLNRFGAVSMALALEQHCERIKEPTRAKVYAALEEVSSSLSKQAGADKVKRIRATASERIDGALKSGKVTKEQACDQRSAQSLQPALGELKRMQCEVAGSQEACADLRG